MTSKGSQQQSHISVGGQGATDGEEQDDEEGDTKARCRLTIFSSFLNL